MTSPILFAPFAPRTLEPKDSIGARWPQLLEKLDLAAAVKGKRTAIKMHLGGGSGFSTIHPYFVRKLVQAVRAAGAKEVFVTEIPDFVRSAAERGYTSETIGCALVPASGTSDRYAYTRPIEPAFLSLKEVHLSGEIVDAEALIDLSHVKAHGACGFGGASKNLSMGCVTHVTRGALHALEGGLDWAKEKCTGCRVCEENCPNGAITVNDKGEWSVFYHNCKFCQHCVLICPEKAITMVGGRYRDFQKGMALTTSQILKTFAPENTLFISFIMDVTIFCDCWGMTTPSLIPDVGVVAGRDIVAIERATLDLIRTEDLIPGAMPEDFELGSTGHLFERIHRKDPYAIAEELETLGHGSRSYELLRVE